MYRCRIDMDECPLSSASVHSEVSVSFVLCTHCVCRRQNACEWFTINIKYLNHLSPSSIRTLAVGLQTLHCFDMFVEVCISFFGFQHVFGVLGIFPLKGTTTWSLQVSSPCVARRMWKKRTRHTTCSGLGFGILKSLGSSNM